ncbi:hypothetical protein LWI28_016769 [Acer negundo]|uniref:MULE transposase domain-containing protein n=1 Tax=Acer negundo TaxID=4023 RepID=A0AAD5JDR2_ACENE|nr:hypothetical protein LWI28_016769 [Acer negundo]
MLGEDRVIPQVCVSVTERTTGDVIGNDIPSLENTQQLGSFSGKNQVFTQRSDTEGGGNMCGVPPVAVDHEDLIEPQFGDVFGCRNEQYNEENNYPNPEVDNEANNEQVNDRVDDLQNMDEDPAQIETRGRHVQGVSCTLLDMPGPSEVRYNVTASAALVIPGADSYSFDIDTTSTLATIEPRTMIYKGQFFSSKKDLKRLVGHFAMYHNFEWKVKRSNKTTLHLVCIIDDCTWKLREVRRDEGIYFQQNPGTITDLQCTDDDKFLYFFMSLWSSIRGFRRCIRPVIAVDGTHLKGRFGGTMFVATTQDGNEQVYPIAFGYGDLENNLSWEWFLECLRGALGNIDDLVFISDRHASIEAGISKVFPYATHTICCWHFGENMKKRFHRKDVADIMNDAARSYRELKYNRHMEKLRKLHKAAFDFAIVAGPHKWSRVHCPQRRYKVMTTNVAECINSCLKFARQLPLMTLAEFIRNMLQKWFHDRHAAARSMRHRLTDAAHLVILKGSRSAVL